MKNIPTRIQHPVYSAAALKSANPVLLEGEVVYESDTRKRKVGNGTTAWNDLPYEGTEGVPGAIPAENIVQNPTHRFVTDAEKESFRQAAEAQFSSINIIDDTESRTIGAGDNDYAQTGFAVGAVAVGDQFALSVGSIDLLAGTATGFTAQLYDYSANVALADAATLTADSRTAVYTVTRAADKAHLILYAGRWGSTAGNTVRYEKVMLVRGNKPEPSWSPSTADRQAEIDNLRPASVNILPDSAALTTDANGGPWARNGAGPVNETYEGYSSLVLRGLSGIAKGVYIVSSDLETESGTEYVVSVWVHASKSVSIALGWEKAANVRTTLPAEAAGKWYRLSAVQNRPAGSSFVCYADVGTDDTVAFRNIMCSAGNMPAAWTPSIADLRSPATTSAAGLLSAADKLKLDRCFPACGISDSGAIEVSGSVMLSQLLRYESEFGMWTTRIVAATSSSIGVYDDITDKADKPIALDVLVVKADKTSVLKIQCSFFLLSTTVTVEKEYNYLVLHFVRGGKYYSCTGIDKLSY